MKKSGSMFRLISLLLVASLIILGGCGGSDQDSTNNMNDTLSSNQEDVVVEEFYQLPLPGEFFSSLRDLGVKSKPNLLNPTENIASYTTSAEKAVNFGVYSSDLFYCSTFNLKTDILKYFDNLKRLADDLGISSVVTQETITRIEKNLSNKDSLNNITTKVFYDASAALENSGQGSTLALVIAGGLTESIYLSTKLVSDYKDGSAAIQLIADQKFPMDNLFAYFGKFPDDANISQISGKIAPLQTVFNSLTETAKDTMASKDGRKIIGSETLIMMNAEDYKKIIDKAAFVRNSLISKSSN
ncbi:MAG: hypothetical protein WED33_10885 [Bacteroidia bacterium]